MEVYGTEAHSPREIAQRVQSVGEIKARLPMLSMVALAVLAGAFIAFGAIYFTVITADPGIGFAFSRLLGGLTFSLGLILVVIAGAELFTGNNLMVMAWVSRRISMGLLLRNLSVVYVGNLLGAFGMAVLVVLSGHASSGDSGAMIGERAVAIAEAKAALSFSEAFFRGILCNVLVCLAVWLAMGARSVSGKILAIVFPVSAFVAAGFEHCVANMYFLPVGLLLAEATSGAEGGVTLGWFVMVKNLVPVTLGNLVGGAGLVGLVYYVIYIRPGEVET